MGETTASPAAQVRSQPPGVVTREDKSLLVGRQAVDRGPQEPWHGVDALGGEVLAAGLEDETVLVAARHDAGPELYPCGAQLRRPCPLTLRRRGERRRDGARA
jgi:hypothetical protein